MQKVLIYLLIKNDFNWNKTFNDLKNRISIDTNKINEIIKRIDFEYISIISPNYPKYLTKVYKPPFELFYLGNYNLLNKKRISILGHINDNNLPYLKLLINNEYVLCFDYLLMNKNDIKVLIKNNIPSIIYFCDPAKTKEFGELLNDNICLISEYCIKPKKTEESYFNRLFFGYKEALMIIDKNIELNEFQISHINNNKINVMSLFKNNKSIKNINPIIINELETLKLVFIYKNY